MENAQVMFVFLVCCLFQIKPISLWQVYEIASQHLFHKYQQSVQETDGMVLSSCRPRDKPSAIVDVLRWKSSAKKFIPSAFWRVRPQKSKTLSKQVPIQILSRPTMVFQKISGKLLLILFLLHLGCNYILCTLRGNLVPPNSVMLNFEYTYIGL